MITIGLADIIDENDPCTPGSPSYDPNDPICALTATGGEIAFDPDPVTRTCAPGYVLQNGACYPALAVGPAQAGMATSLESIGWKPLAILVGALGLIGGIGYAISKRKARA
jgi:hypothetical protein